MRGTGECLRFTGAYQILICTDIYSRIETTPSFRVRPPSCRVVDRLAVHGNAQPELKVCVDFQDVAAGGSASWAAAGDRGEHTSAVLTDTSSAGRDLPGRLAALRQPP